MAVTIQPNDVVVFYGDSKTIGSNGPEMLGPLRAAIAAYYRGSSPPSLPPGVSGVAPRNVTVFDRGVPKFINSSTAGNTTNNLVAELSTKIYAYNPHVVIIAIETNDADPAAAVSNATFTTNINTAIAGIRANCPRLRSNGILWVQATCFSEKWPFGQNVNDLTATGLGAKDDILRQRASALTFDVAELRTDSTAVGGGAGPWLDYESINNVPGPGSSFGFLTSDGRHDIAAGCTLVSNLALAKLQLTG